MTDPHRKLVETGYDRVAGRYPATRDPRDPPVPSAPEEMAGGNAGETRLWVLVQQGFATGDRTAIAGLPVPGYQTEILERGAKRER